MNLSKMLTDSQVRMLQEVRAGRVEFGQVRFYSTVFPPAVRSDVVRRLVDRGLCSLAFKRGEKSTSVVLTRLGDEALRDIEAHNFALADDV